MPRLFPADWRMIYSPIDQAVSPVRIGQRLIGELEKSLIGDREFTTPKAAKSFLRRFSRSGRAEGVLPNRIMRD